MKTATLFALACLKKAEQFLLILGHGIGFFAGLAQGIEAHRGESPQIYRSKNLSSSTRLVEPFAMQQAKSALLKGTRSLFLKQKGAFFIAPLSVQSCDFYASLSYAFSFKGWFWMSQARIVVKEHGAEAFTKSIGLAITTSKNCARGLKRGAEKSFREAPRQSRNAFASEARIKWFNEQLQALFTTLPSGSVIECRQDLRIKIVKEEDQNPCDEAEQVFEVDEASGEQTSHALCLQSSKSFSYESSPKKIGWEKIVLGALIACSSIALMLWIFSPSDSEKAPIEKEVEPHQKLKLDPLEEKAQKEREDLKI